MNIETWKEDVENDRRQKDFFFGSHFESPLSAGEREGFQGLRYWPPDPEYRFETEFREHSDKKVRKVQDTGGNVRDLIRWGEFRFRAGGRECVLHAYKSDPEEKRLFVPFRDTTSSRESYGAGRYIDLEPPGDMTEEGRCIFELNKAYNPWCAYSDAYVCPFVPPENCLKVPIRAGEKSFHSLDNEDE